MVVLVGLAFIMAAAGDGATATGQVDTVTPPVVVQDVVGLTLAPIGTLHLSACLLLMVPNRSYYRVSTATVGAGFVGLVNWTEMTLIEPISGGF